MNVVSLFDGISCGQVSLEKAGLHVGSYFASEIDKYAIKVTQANYPNTIQLGDVRGICIDKLPKIDLLIGGSPCQGFSFAGKQLNFDDPRSKLFFKYVEILNALKPKYFLFENVVMKPECRDVITALLGVEPIAINSVLVSAQLRPRWYWTNIPNVVQPEDRNIDLKDILEETVWTVPGEYYGCELNKGTILGRRLNERGVREDNNSSIPRTQCLEVRASSRNKSNCLTTVAKDTVLTPLGVGRYSDAFKNKLPFRYYTVKECCRLQTLPDNYVDVITESKARKCLGNGWTVDVIAHILSFIGK